MSGSVPGEAPGEVTYYGGWGPAADDNDLGIISVLSSIRLTRRVARCPLPMNPPPSPMWTPTAKIHSDKLKMFTKKKCWRSRLITKLFMAKYVEKGKIGSGGYGSVFAGYRKEDNVPVAIKHIPQTGVKHAEVTLEGKVKWIPLEVALMLRVSSEPVGNSAAVALLDWYDLDKELILILERPLPCCDLLDYINTHGPLEEHKARIITKQLVDALIEIQSRGVFHRDIKLTNILIETGSDEPRVRIIDFGCGTFQSKKILKSYQGMLNVRICMPEWFKKGRYRAGPATVWQLGTVLYEMLHGHLPFCSEDEIVLEDAFIYETVSIEAEEFLESCLIKTQTARPTLETLRDHPWLN
ncbi:serine/threonine-protein kinase pim-1-like [Cheilinus undulatus]|uniref:serine/threonine-protein kinase pim-1-like n=1 Tax=Cheilinus undulatus TaxID=241271 RepID=UPI001BD267A9|nr:serine/threonine-protein kinase pim-1-like [Cheilinus undulatus]